MSTSAVGPVSASLQQTSTLLSQTQSSAPAPDGDSPAIEKAETSGIKISEAQNGGFAPPKSATSGNVNILV